MANTGDNIRFVEFNGPGIDGGSSISSSRPTIHKYRLLSGCYVSAAKGLILLLLSLLITIGVGLTVYFLTSSGGESCECWCTWTGEGATEKLWDMCLEQASKKNECLVTAGCPESSTPAPLPTAAPLPKDVRLPDNLVPLHYNVILRPNIYTASDKNFNSTGYVQMHFRCDKATDVIIIHANNISVLEDSPVVEAIDMDSTRVRRPKVESIDYDETRQFLKFHLETPLESQSRYHLSLNFTGSIGDNLAGLYKSSYVVDNVTHWIAATQFQPTDARMAFPCMDEPALKATFNITLQRKANMTALSNMPLLKSEPMEDGWYSDHFDTTALMSTYLLAFVVCDFTYVENSTNSGVKMRVWARPEAVLNGHAHYALEKGIEMLEYFENYFQIEFPLPKQDMMAIPDFAAGAMENWGLILYRETALLYDPKSASKDNKQRVAVVISHELAHQWFGNLVTPKWWDDLWLNEGFASYVEYIGVNNSHPGWKMMDQFVTEDLQDVMKTDSLCTSHPIYVPVYHPEEINEIFDKISYGKGASVIRMMNGFLGEEVFKKGLTAYLNKHKYDNADHKDLWAALAEEASRNNIAVDVKEVMATWILQMGYPVVTIRRFSKSRLELAQSYFRMDPSQPASTTFTSPYNYTWDIPLTFETDVSTNANESKWWNSEIVWMHRNNITYSNDIAENTTWVIGNIRAMGVYRVNYDTENWEALIAQLDRNHTLIPPKNRAQTMDDAFNMGRAGMISQLLGFKCTNYLSKEDHFLPWETAIGNFEYVDTMMMLSPYYGHFQRYLLKLVTPNYKKFSWRILDDALDQRIQNIALSYACKNGMPECIAEAKKRYQAFMDSPEKNEIPPDFRLLVYCNAIRNGGEKEWDFAFDRYKQETVNTEKDKLLYALACSRQPWLNNRFLSRIMDTDTIRKQEAVYAMVYLSRNPVARTMVWEFVQSNWDTLVNDYVGGFFAVSRLVSGVTNHFNTDFQLQSLLNHMEKHPQLGSGTRTFQQAIEATRANMQWMEKNEKAIGEWLKKIVG